MTQRSIYAGKNPFVIIKAGTGVTVEGWDSEQVMAETSSRWGIKVEKKSEAEIARARAAIGSHVLFDVRLNKPANKENQPPQEVIEVQIGSNGKVLVPLGSRVKIYAGTNAEASDLHGSLAIFAGGSVRVRSVHAMIHGSAGGAFDVECETVDGNEVKLEAGRDLRCYIRDLTSARVVVSDLGGNWEGKIGEGKVTLQLKAGGDVTLVTDQNVEPVPPFNVLGQIEKKSA